jgi:hypothetical protein
MRKPIYDPKRRAIWTGSKRGYRQLCDLTVEDRCALSIDERGEPIPRVVVPDQAHEQQELLPKAVIWVEQLTASSGKPPYLWCNTCRHSTSSYACLRSPVDADGLMDWQLQNYSDDWVPGGLLRTIADIKSSCPYHEPDQPTDASCNNCANIGTSRCILAAEDTVLLKAFALDREILAKRSGSVVCSEYRPIKRTR